MNGCGEERVDPHQVEIVRHVELGERLAESPVVGEEPLRVRRRMQRISREQITLLPVQVRDDARLERGYRLPNVLRFACLDDREERLCAGGEGMVVASLRAAERTMYARGAHRLPVVQDDGRLVGLISVSDIAAHARVGATGNADALAPEVVVSTLAALRRPIRWES